MGWRILCQDGVVAIELHPSTPVDVLVYRKRQSNMYHDGGACNFIEAMDESSGVKAAWDRCLGKRRWTM